MNFFYFFLSSFFFFFFPFERLFLLSFILGLSYLFTVGFLRNKINVKQILSENQNLKIALKAAVKQKNDKNDNCEANNDPEIKNGKNNEKRNESLILLDFHSIELELYQQMKNIICHLTLSNLLQLPHIMDLLTILGESNMKLGSDFLIRLQNIFEFKPKLMERTDVSTNLNEKLDDDNPVFISISLLASQLSFLSFFCFSAVFNAIFKF